MTVLVMVGLPARGKSFIGKKLERFLFWRGEEVQIFNVGDRRRKYSPAGLSHAAGQHNAQFFGANNRTLREEIAHGVLYEMIQWLRNGQDVAPPGTSAASGGGSSSSFSSGVTPVDLSDSGRLFQPTGARSPQTSPPQSRPPLSRSDVSEEDAYVREAPPPRRPNRTAIFDATNSSVERRRAVTNTLAKELPSCRVVFVESICDDASVLERNLAQKIAMSPDYQGMEFALAIADLRERINKYESQYESLSVKVSAGRKRRKSPRGVAGRRGREKSAYPCPPHCTPTRRTHAQSSLTTGGGRHRAPLLAPPLRVFISPFVTHPAPPLALLSSSSTSPQERLSFIKLFNLSSQLHLNLIYGTVAKSLVPYMMGIHIGRRPIWLVRAAHCVGTPDAATADGADGAADGQSSGSKTVIVARSAGLSEEGLRFAQRLGRFCNRRCAEFTRQQDSNEGEPGLPTITEGVASLGGGEPSAAPLGGMAMDGRSVSGEWSAVLDDPLPSGCAVFTSTLPRAIQTAACIETGTLPPNASSALNPIDRGTAYGLTEDQFAEQQPEAFARWSADPRHTRFPGGESYADLISRIEPLLIELEQQTSPVLVVSHLSTLQLLASYFTGVSLTDALATSIPHHTVLQLRPASQKMMWEQELIPLNCDADEAVARGRELM